MKSFPSAERIWRPWGVSETTLAALSDAQMHDLALALQSRYVQYGGGFDRLVLRYASELFAGELAEEHQP